VNEFNHISVEELKAMLDETQVTLVDIRDAHTFSQGHIPHAKSVNDENLELFLQEADKTKPLICYCYHGISSQSAAHFFAQQGFQNVFSMDGGYEKWRSTYVQ
jgi:thiosulfate sulfurtransferase